ncbi:vacuolating cytotoxin domain-containing protein [Helicobacter pylori]|uniref:Putative vacuolating cytotoxin family protein n=1 Tax=Helicobacter pylori Hp H-24 TaxID=992039 RepID=I9RWL7_HELPX|nr:vacuolating cytotoxin domain-containing protein [Helicobacter pylori]EJB50841.1 putative vacuolating cytotoxin family protein [Helicobacter pylori Hp H-24]EJC16977.1 vacuolating cytotoxin family protein [Helicobacter pylori Hp H-24b]EJC19127.1 vacuolating cytotoxin family protein [Helicobacter pylori Hp H-24c]EJC38226.1 putative vacuolating cytotoxin family protein [Helicobacter pylori Hp M1]EJC41150.1 putative vacuolating cytotoxin family protein [Helicobacter pylori Hp M2]
MAFKKARLISRFISKGSFKLNKISKKFFTLNQILKREKPLKRHKKTKSIEKPFNKNKSFLKASVLLIGALGGLSHLRANECRYWSWSSWSYQDNIESGPNSPTHNSYCLFSSTQGSGTYYLNTLTTYSAGGASFTQKFNNGTLDIGGNIRFGGTGINGGDVGYITGTYDAQTINFNSSHITTGNSYADGGGATLNFNATNNITINQASFDNSDAGTQKSYMNFKGSNIKVSGSSFTDDTDGGFSFSGSDNNSAISFNQTSFNQGTYDFSNSATLSFNNSNFNQGTYDFNDSVSFNNNTFNQGTYHFNTSKVSFSGANTLNSSSPFASLKGSVSFNSNAIFNLNQTLNNNQTYDILTTNGAIQYGVYQSYLWDLINYKGDKAISHVEVGNNTYDVTFDINGQDETLQETFSNQSITTQFLGDDLQQQAQQTYQEDLTNSKNALRGATSDNTIASADTSYTQSKNATVAKDAQNLENTNQKIQKDQQDLEKDLDNLKQLANSTTGFNEQAFNQAQKQEQQDEQTLQNDENAFNTKQDSLNKAIQQAQAQQQKQEQQQAQQTYQEDLTNSQNALRGATSDNAIASNDIGYTQSKNATILKDAQNLENTNQKIQQDEQALEQDLDNLKQLANPTTGFNEQAFKNAQSKEQQDEQTLQNEENAFNTEQEGLEQAIANAKPTSPTPTPTKHTAPNTPPSKVSPTPTPPTQNLPAENVWNGVYNLQNQTYSNKGIYYIDPNLSGQSGQSGNTLSTYTANLLGRSFGVNANNGTLIIGNNTESVNDNGLIWIGHGGFGYITGTFSAANIYLTNNFKTGEGVSNSDGGGANITFKASDNITMDGLNYNNAETVTKMIQTGASQHSYTTFDATNNISVTNSSFSDMTWGKFSFSAENISFSNASFSGFTNPGGSSTISANASNSLSFIDSRLNGGAVYNLQANSLIFNNTQAVFNVLYSRGTSNFNATTQLLGNTSFTLSSQSLLNFNGDTTLQNNANITLGNKSQAAFKNSLTLDNNSNLSLDNQSVLNASGASAFNNQASLNIYNGSQAAFSSLFFNGGTLSLNASSKLSASNASFSNNTTINLDDSVLSANNTSSLNANINFQGASQADFGGNTTIDTASFNFDSASSLNFNNLTANGALNFNGYAPSLTKALMSVSGQFVLGSNGDINLSDINIFDNITKSVTYNILNAQKGITGISGANGYEKILFYGMKIQNATYSDNNNIQTWSFINPLNSSQIIQESIKNGDLTIEVLNNPNSASNTIFNIAPELYNYQASKQNPTGYSYDYSDNQAGTYYLTSNIKGLFTPKGSQTPQAPGTYSPFNQPLSSLNIYNKGFSSENLKTLLGILSQNSATLKEMIESNQLDNITNINEVLQLLDKIKITQAQKQALLETINHLTDNINQTFNNGNLVIGATQDNVTNSTSSIWFGGNGYSSPCTLDSATCSSFRNTYLGQLLGSTSPYLGYINADFKAKSIYITGTIGSGNAFESGGSADVTFQSANNLVLNKANIEAQATDNIFNLLGQEGIDKIFNQGNLANVLSQMAMEKIKQAGGLGNFIENALSPLSKELPASLQDETLGQLIGQNNLDDLLNNSGVMNEIQNIISQKLSIFGNFVTPSIIENYLAKQSLKSMLDDKGLLNFIGGYIDASEISSILSVILKDITNPPTSLQKDIGVVANDLLNEFLGQDVVKKLESQGLVSNIINNIISQGGLSGVYNQGLGSVLPPSLQNALKENDLGALLSPRGLHDFWQKGYFNFLSNGYVFVNNSSFSNATGGSLNFVANKSIIFNGDNTIDFSKYQGTLIFASNGVSNINITTLNATNGLSLNAGLNNVSVQKGEICINLANCPTTKNSSSTNFSVTPTNETLSVRANNFTFLGAIASNGAIDLSQVTNNSVIGTLNLNENATLQANNLTITNAFDNASNSTANINGNFTLNQQATLSTNANGLNVMGNFNSYGDLVFNLSHSVSHAIINTQGTATIMANDNNPLIQFNASSKEVGTYTLIDSAKAIYYGYNNQITGGSSLDNYLKLYALIDINGKHMVMTDNGLTYNGQAVSVKDGGLVVGFKDSQNQYIYTSILYNKVKIAVSNDPINNPQAPTLKQYIAQIQGVQSVDSIDQAGGNQAINWLNKIFETKGSPLFAPYYLESHSTKDLTTIAGDIANTLEVIANPNFKNDATNILQINTYTQQMSRLAKLSDTSTFARSDFLERLEALKNKRFADAIPNAMDVILKYSQRNRVKNNVWATGVGGASFISGGTGTLYGINIGYDRFIKGVIVGGYAAYGYSGFHANITQSGSSNVNMGVYSRAFIKRSELTMSLNETWGYNKTFINSYDPLLSIINQSYRYDTWTTDAKINYGYDFMFKDKSVIFKPQVGLAYYYIGLSGLRGIMDDPIYNQFRANADPNKKSVLTINFALESRHYFNKNSYYFVIADVGRDLFINSMGDKMVRFIGNNTLSYRDGGRYNTFASIITGGEIRLFKTFYVNAGIGARFGLDYKDINITGNIGMRYAF